jgi:predicted Co/Zn/Cd cation transporter (cation efflux family)
VTSDEQVRPLRDEQRALRVSMVISVGIGVVALVWGLAAGSQVILLDSVYVILGLGLSWLGLYASRVVAAGPTPRFPFGRESLVPLVVSVQGLALIGTLVYAAFEAVRVILDGGSDVAAAGLAAYGAFSGLASLAAWAFLRRSDPTSDLLRAEAASWLAGAVGSLVIAVGAGVVLLLRLTAWRGVEPYADSALVLATCVLLAPVPLRMLRQAAAELLGSAAEPAVERGVREIVDRVRLAEGLPEPVLRTSKVARKLIIEVGFVVPSGRFDVADEDRVRRALHAGLASLPYDPWLVVELTTDPELVA